MLGDRTLTAGQRTPKGGQIVFRDETAGQLRGHLRGRGLRRAPGRSESAPAPRAKIAEILEPRRTRRPPPTSRSCGRLASSGSSRERRSPTDFLVGEDIDAVSGATCRPRRASPTAVRNAMHVAATAHFKLKPTWKQPVWSNSVANEIGLVGVFALAFLVTYAKGPVAKWGRLAMPDRGAGLRWDLHELVALDRSARRHRDGLHPGSSGSTALWWIMMAGVLGGVRGASGQEHLLRPGLSLPVRGAGPEQDQRHQSGRQARACRSRRRVRSSGG